jgi:hypothetical protein
MDHA